MKQFEHGGRIYGDAIRLDFSVNTNPLGIDDKIKEAAKAAADAFGAYPDQDYRGLKEAIAKHEGVKVNNIAVSNGASEMIFAAVRAVMPKRALLISPTFSEYERALLSSGCRIEYYDTRAENGFSVGADFIQRLDDADMAFICNPNNPTGTLLAEDILSAAARAKTLCVFDECFLDFTDGRSMKGDAPVIKAFTKTYAMAGLRLGYIIGEAEFISKINRVLPMWNINSAAEKAAYAALGLDDYINESRRVIKNERAYLSEKLRALGFEVFPSEANFILVRGQKEIGKALRARGILIRECGNFRALDAGFYRIAVKKHEENEILIRELGDICG